MLPFVPKPRWRTLDIMGGVLLLLALIVGAGCFAVFHTLSQDHVVRENGRQIALVRDEVSQLLEQVALAESAQRGYLLTGEDGYLAPYREAEATVRAILARLSAMSGDHPVRAGRLAELRDLTARKFDEMRQTLPLVRAGRTAEARALVTSDQGQALFERIEAQGRRMNEEERRALEASYAASDRRQRALVIQLLLLILAMVAVLVLAALAIRRSAHARAAEAYLREVRAQRDRADLLRREMSHRVKNLFAVIMSIISTTGRAETDPVAAARKTRERVQALARAHALTSGQDELLGADLGDLVRAVAGAYVPPGRDLQVEGPAVTLDALQTTPLGLVLNELATNAVKYGGWAGEAGTVRVSWQLIGSNGLDFLWEETEIAPRNGEPATGARGFGTTMIDLSAQQAGATVERKLEKGTFVFRMKLRLPQKDGSANHGAAETGR